jgi:hypothetical protein
MIDDVLEGLYDSGIQFEICCCYSGGFRVRLGSPATGFSAAVVVDTYDAVVQQLRATALVKYPQSAFAQKYAPFVCGAAVAAN